MKDAGHRLKMLMRGTTALVAFGFAGDATAKEFKVNDDISITTNVTLSAGITFRTEDRSSEAILPGNGAAIGVAGVAASATQDDGNLNFDKGDIVSAPITAVVDAEFNYRDDIGFFIRGKGVFDAALENKRVDHGNAVNGFAAGERLSDDGFNTLAQFSNATILDAFLFGEVDAGPVPVEIRVGRQVISWGEGVFIQNGINSINPIDVTAFRKPGVQLKEGLLPLGMFYANAGVTDNLSLEGFWNFEWQQTQPDGCGTFFSTVDVISQGCNVLSLASVGAAVGAAQAADIAALAAPLAPAIAQVTAGIAAADAAGNIAVSTALSAQLAGLQAQLDAAAAGIAFVESFGTDAGAVAPETIAATGGFFLNRSGDVGPNDFEPDQFGVALRYFADPIDTEFGLYFTRLASRVPLLGFTTGTIAAPLPAIGNAPGAATFFVEYPEAINTVGFSAATTLFGQAVAGELSYRNNQPIQINSNDFTLAALTQGNSGFQEGTVNPADALFQNATGTQVEGFIETDQIRGQMSVVSFFDRVMGADRITTIGELGFEYLPFLNSDNPLGLHLGRSSVFGNPGAIGNTTEGLTTQFSAGFRGRISADYTNVFLGVNMTPSISVAQDIVGYSSDSQFIEGRTSLGFGLNFDYLNKFTLGLSYTTSFGGTFNAFDDRDFASAVVSVQF